MTIKTRILATESSGSVLFIRLMVGCIFLSEGIQKFIFPTQLGSGHFLTLGFPLPYFSAGFAAILEIICSILILLGFYTRLASIPLLVISVFSIVAIQLPVMVQEGFWSMLHSARTDWCMFLGCCFLLLRGGGRWSLDRKWGKF